MNPSQDYLATYTCTIRLRGGPIVCIATLGGPDRASGIFGLWVDDFELKGYPHEALTEKDEADICDQILRNVMEN